MQVLQGNISLKQPHYIQMSDGSLLINPVQFDDGGKYVCRVSNEEGEVSKELRLRVRKTEEVCGRRMSEEFNGSGNEIWQRNKRVADGEVVAGIHEWPWQVSGGGGREGGRGGGGGHERERERERGRKGRGGA